MKKNGLIGLLAGLFFSSGVWSLNPIDGFYVGVLGGISAGPSEYRTSFLVPPYSSPNSPVVNFPPGSLFGGTVHNSWVGGGGGAALGYRLRNFRVEAEAFYNYISADHLIVDRCRLQSPDVLTPLPTDSCSQFSNTTTGIEFKTGFNGSTTVFIAMVNGFYDIVAYDNEDVSFAPYVGFGIGKAYGRERFNFVNTVTTNPQPNVPSSFGIKSPGRSTAAAQGIIGISYFLDDYAWISMDYRYISTGTINDPLNGNRRYALNTLNFVINFSFDNGTNA